MKYKVQGPDGKTYTIEGPEGASDEEVIAQAQKLLAPQKPDEFAFDPERDMSMAGRFVAGMGQGVSKIGRAIGQAAGQYSDEELAEASRLDAPLMKSGAAKAGAFTGGVMALAPTMMIPGANTYAGAAGIGALTGAMTTEGGLEDRAKAAGLGALGGAAGKFAGDKITAKLAEMAQAKAAQSALQQGQNATKDATLLNGRNVGYVVPPSQIDGASIAARVAEGLGGKIKTEQAASIRNQAVTNDLARAELGLQKGAPITPQTLANIRKQAGSAYETVAKSGRVYVDKNYLNDVANLGGQYRKVLQDFPELANQEVEGLVTALWKGDFDARSAVELVKKFRSDGVKNTVSMDPSKNALGKAQLEASKLMDDMLDRHMMAQGAPDAVAALKDARQLIAKSYTVQNALNQGTGNVRANKLANLLQKEKPLSGGLKQAAEFAQAYPKSMQEIAGVAPYSVLDAFGAGVGSAINPLITAGVAARPMVRSMVLSKAAQARMNPSYGSNGLMELLDQGASSIPGNLMLRTAPIALVPASQ